MNPSHQSAARSRRAWLAASGALIACTLAASAPADNGVAAVEQARHASTDSPRIAPPLAARLAGADGPLPVLVTLRAQVRGGNHAGQPTDLIGALRRTAGRSQSALLARLGRPARRLWLVNAVALRAPLAPPLPLSVSIDRTPPAIRLAVRRVGLLSIEYRATASDGVAAGALRSRLSDGGQGRGPAAGRHAFAGHGPYWIELEAHDRAGNIRRVRRVVRWPAGAVARRVAWTEAFGTMGMPFLMARLQRKVGGRYEPPRELTDLLAANAPYQRFAALRRTLDPPPRGAVGVYSDGRRRLRLSIDVAGRRYFIEDLDGRVTRGVSVPVNRPAFAGRAGSR